MPSQHSMFTDISPPFLFDEPTWIRTVHRPDGILSRPSCPSCFQIDPKEPIHSPSRWRPCLVSMKSWWKSISNGRIVFQKEVNRSRLSASSFKVWTTRETPRWQKEGEPMDIDLDLRVPIVLDVVTRLQTTVIPSDCCQHPTQWLYTRTSCSSDGHFSIGSLDFFFFFLWTRSAANDGGPRWTEKERRWKGGRSG